ncbi:auxin response factor 22-like [Phragmites australis]|uniref:auxin response factor 22-like n=1 Tax=Phragmites australis TaxID=29695 RepID=UPI002D79AC75|nr:auxin response factor 22-like [Phragmites australis]
MKETGEERCLDPQLWHACAGGMVQMPPVRSRVYYFPQGHAEHAHGGGADLAAAAGPRALPALVLCSVAGVRFLADPETDEVFAKIRLVPVAPGEVEFQEPDELVGDPADAREKLASFAKTLTQSDANNGGGFSVPRYCAETIFPKLDYRADPPVQTVLAKDVHGEVWKFRHIYRGTPRRHLLTTGWSTFVNQKKLVAGDSIVFLRTEHDELCVGIRRAKRVSCGGMECMSGWNAPGYGGFSAFLKEEESKLMKGPSGYTRGRGKVKIADVMDAASLAASGQSFEVVYYPRASTPEFVVKAASVQNAMRIQWCPGMRFKMAFETEDSSRISWFMGTISSVQIADPIRWTNSPWRLLQVAWDEPDLLQNVKCVNPWLVELISSIPPIHLGAFSPPRKKLRVPQHPDFPFDGQLLNPIFHGNPLGPSNSPICCFPDNAPAGIQGARHAQFGLPLTDHQLNKLHRGLFQGGGFNRLDAITPPSRISKGFVITSAPVHESVSCLLTIGTSQSADKSDDRKKPHIMLFGKPILTEQQMNSRASSETFSPEATGNSSSSGNVQKRANVSYGSGSSICIGFSSQASELGLEAGHCKVFMESEDVGRTIDLSVFGSYEELYGQLADMFGIEKAELISHLRYRDAAGAVKHTGEEPFSDFMKVARRLTIIEGSGGRLQKPLMECMVERA